MSKKILRIHAEGPSSETDWFENKQGITEKDIDTIQVQKNTLGLRIPTSIPSPFARIALVKNAFKTVINEELDGDTDNHKLVSDALDIGQILFNYDRFSNDLQLLAWDKGNNLKELLNSKTSGTKKLGETLDLFLMQDANTYNFHHLERILILKYKHKVIGGTSPATLFFASPDSHNRNVHIKFGNDTMLDNKYLALYKREPSYIKYLYSLSKTSNFNDYFPELNKYIDKTIEQLNTFNPNFYSELKRLVLDDYLKELKDLTVNNTPGNLADIVGIKLYKNSVIPKFESDFFIESKKSIKGKIPLVLPVDTFNSKIIYVGDFWNPNTKVPYKVNEDLQLRKLPELGIQYQFLTISDFLKDEIIRIPYDIDGNNFMTVGSQRYLFPLTDLFFNYYTAADIEKKVTMRELAGDAVEVKLEIPIKKISTSIVYIKKYQVKTSGINDDKVGEVIDSKFSLCIYPFINTDTKIDSRIGVVDMDEERKEGCEVEVINTKVESINVEIKNNNSKGSKRAIKGIDPYSTIYYVVQGFFDGIKIVIDKRSSLIIPKTRVHAAGGTEFDFAIDFGTTNTHIEYKVNSSSSPYRFAIDNNDKQLVFLRNTNVRSKELIYTDLQDGESYLLQELQPQTIGDVKVSSFPQRSILLETHTIDYDTTTYTLADTNIGFDFERKHIKKHLFAQTGIKWSNMQDTKNSERLRHFIQHTLFLIKNKVLLNKGTLSNTKLTWFYPSSMSQHKINKLTSTWDKNTEEVFGDKINIKSLPESLAPFYYYSKKAKVSAREKPVISFDIGGGTTDVVIFREKRPEVITSFKFAGEALFGDGYNSNINQNGFYLKFNEKYEEYFKKNNLVQQSAILENIKNKGGVDFCNFLFTQSNNKLIDSSMNFGALLSDDENLKIVFLVYFGAINFHIANLMKVKKLDIPQYLLFSGTASKALHILDGDKEFREAGRFFTHIFKNVFGVKDAKDIVIKMEEEPKETTARGGLYIEGSIELNDIEEVVFLGGKDTYAHIQSSSRGTFSRRPRTDRTYNTISDELVEDVVSSIKQFFRLVDKIGTDINYNNSFGITEQSYKIFKEIRNESLRGYIREGVELKMIESGSNEADYLDETLFFYPLIPMLNELVYQTSQL